MIYSRGWSISLIHFLRVIYSRRVTYSREWTIRARTVLSWMVMAFFIIFGKIGQIFHYMFKLATVISRPNRKMLSTSWISQLILLLGLYVVNLWRKIFKSEINQWFKQEHLIALRKVQNNVAFVYGKIGDL